MSRQFLLAVLFLGFVLLRQGKTEVLEGKVLEINSGTPLALAEIRLIRVNPRAVIAELETDRFGVFHTPNLPAGEYSCETSKPNYVSNTIRVPVPGKSAGILPISIRLVHYGVVSGKVADGQNQPILGAHVYAIPKPADGGAFRPYNPFSRDTSQGVDAEGRFRIYNLLPGEYALVVTYGASTMSMGSFGNAPRQTTGSGVLYYPNNSQPQVFRITSGEEFRDLNFTVVPTAPLSVKGKISDPPQNGQVWLALTPIDQPAFAAAVAIAEKNGEFRFEGISSGCLSFCLPPGPPRHADHGARIWKPEPDFGRMRIEVSGASPEDITVPLQKGRSVAFSLKAERGCPQTAKVTLSSLEEWGAALEKTLDVNADQPGKFSSLAPTRYHVEVSGLPSQCFHPPSPVLDLTATDNPPNSVSVVIRQAGTIRGKFKGEVKGDDVKVMLLSPSTEDGNTPLQTTLPDAEGHFGFEGLAPGRYRILARLTNGGIIAESLAQLEVEGGKITETELAAPQSQKE